MSNFRVCVSSLAADRLARARALIRDCTPGTRVLIVGPSRGAADDFAREVAVSAPATFGLQRLSLTQVAARTAMVALASEGMTPSTRLGAEAVATRATFDATRAGALSYLGPVADTPGFPRALARTLLELRVAHIEGRRLAVLPLAGRDLAELLDRFEKAFRDASSADRAHLLRTAAALITRTPPADVVLLLDLMFDHPAERAVVEALATSASVALATLPSGDREAIQFLESIGGHVEHLESAGTDDLACLRRFLFATDREPAERALDGTLEFFSAPGEGREAVEIARRILREARAGVRFDEMAIFVRSPSNYLGLIEHALRRARVPAWFDRGTRRPHPAGRAFLALLACASEQLSASRFAEYLSLGQVPGSDRREAAGWVASENEAFGRGSEILEDEAEVERHEIAAERSGADEVIVAGTLRAPWRWERLLVEAAVIGQDADRWKRRLAGKEKELIRQLREASRDDGGEGVKERIQQTLDQLRYLSRFAVPIVELIAAWPHTATWGEWLDCFEQLAPRVLRTPSHVLRILADLRPMAEVGPVDLNEARRVLTQRLLTVESEPPSRRYGRVCVSTPEQARGRSFTIVFVPGLAERMFPQKPREDPLMLDDLRERTDPALATQHQRLASERLLLQLAAGAAEARLYVSYPRIELSESRARVPSFYALDVMRAATGTVPDHETLAEHARKEGNATLAWPAPSRPDDAIDDQEHDLATLRRLLDDTSPDAVKGHAHYLLKLNECLRRSVIARWARGVNRWSPSDGLTRVSPYIKDALAAQRLTSRAYSISSLQRFSACPYQFVLAGIYRLKPLEQPEPLQRMDPLTRGSIFHEIQARCFRALQAAGALPVTSATIDAVRGALAATIDDVAAFAHDELAPAVERVWDDEIASIRRDLGVWLEHVARDGDEWQPMYFEFGFGDVPGERDARSIHHDVVLDGGFMLRGAIDLIEEHRQTKVLRVTDHKTGRRPERIERVIIGGGTVLQPVLYAMAVERALGQPVHHGRLFYCTSAGGFHSHEIPLSEHTRASGLEVLQVVDRAIATGFLAAAPTEEACSRCDFRPVCGRDVFRRLHGKPAGALADLTALRSRP